MVYSMSFYAFFLSLTIFLGIFKPVLGRVVPASTEKLVKDWSLPEILKLTKIPSNFITDGSTKLEEGRIILTPTPNSKGSLWFKTKYSFDHAFTLEWTFRSFNYLGPSTGGIAFWFIEDDISSNKDKNLFNGPSKFKGLQLLIDNSGPYGSTLRAQLNDGSQTLTSDSISGNTFGSCLMGYQDSSVPSTLRLTYDINDNHLLKVQVDNKVCFQTRKIKLADSGRSLQFGVSSNNGKDNTESFEILKVKLYNDVIDESHIPNVKAMDQPIIITKLVDKKTGATKLIDKVKFEAEKNDIISNYDLYKKLDRIEGKVLMNDVRPLGLKLEDIIETQQGLMKFMDYLISSIGSKSPRTDESSQDINQFKEFLALNEKLGILLEEQDKVREATKSQTKLQMSGPHIDDIVSKIKIWLVPFGLILCIMTYFTFRIKQDITKAKLL